MLSSYWFPEASDSSNHPNFMKPTQELSFKSSPLEYSPRALSERKALDTISSPGDLIIQPQTKPAAFQLTTSKQDLMYANLSFFPLNMELITRIPGAMSRRANTTIEAFSPNHTATAIAGVPTETYTCPTSFRAQNLSAITVPLTRAA